MTSKLRAIIFICSIIFIVIDIFFKVASIYELLRIIVYGIAINIMSEYFVSAKRRKKR
jgi:hypothetical protein